MAPFDEATCLMTSGPDHLSLAADFPPAFIAISLLAASAALVFFQLKPDAGEELTGRAWAA